MNAIMRKGWVDVPVVDMKRILNILDWSRDAWSNGEIYSENHTNKEIGFVSRDRKRAMIGPEFLGILA